MPKVEFDKMNKEVEPPKEQLKENQIWKFCAKGWRKQQIQTDEQKAEKKIKMSELGKKSKKVEKELLKKGQDSEVAKEVEKTFQDKITKLEKEKEVITETQQDVKTLINEMKQLNQKVETKVEVKPIEQPKPAETKEPDTIIPQTPAPKKERAHKNPLLKQMMQ